MTNKNSGRYRKLATVFAADVAEYSHHVFEDEDATLDKLNKLREIMDAIIVSYGGRIANTAGDSVIAEFESPLECVRAAFEIQEKHKQHHDQFQNERRLDFRIGVNIGDITVVENGDILGNGVNVAARLEALAKPGGVCLSENVHEQVARTFEIQLSKIGEHYVKNIEKPITVYSIGETRESLFSDLSRHVTNLMKKPATVMLIFLMAVTSMIFVIWSDVKEEQITTLDDQFIQNLETKSEKEILNSFDLVTTGSFNKSTYHVIKTWNLGLEGSRKLAKLLGGYLVSIGSEDENTFLFNLTIRDTGHWKFDDNSKQYFGPLIGLVQKKGSPEPGGGWFWESGEKYQYDNWGLYRPDNGGNDQELAVFHGRLEPTAEWNDVRSPQQSIIVEVTKK